MARRADRRRCGWVRRDGVHDGRRRSLSTSSSADRVARVACVALAAWLAPGAVAFAQVEGYLGQPVGSVRVESDGRAVEDPRVLDLIETRVGQPLAMVRVRESIDHLILLDAYDDVEVDAVEGERGLEIVYRVTPARIVTDLVFRGDVELSRDDLERLIRDRFGSRPRAARMAEMVLLLDAHYREKGYFRPTITAALEPAGEAAEWRLAFNVSAGPRATIGTVRVEGSPVDGPQRLISALRVQTGRPWDAAAVSQRVEEYVAELRKKGRYEARLEVVPAPRQDGSVVDLSIEINPGPVVELVFEGDELPRSRIESLVPVRREGSADEDLLEDSKRRIEEYLHQEGYWKASAEYRRSEEDGGLRVVFRIARGQRYAVSDVRIEGAQSVSAAELRSVMRTQPGTPFVEGVLGADVAAVTAYYRARGFADVKVTSTVRPGSPAADGDGGTAYVAPTLVVEEGAQTRVGAVTIAGNAAIPEATLREAINLAPGAPFYQPQVNADRTSILRAYLNRGYREASVRADASRSGDGRTVDVSFAVTEGPQAIVDHVIVLGNTRTKVDTILRELRLSSGDPVGLGALAEAQRRLSALGLFRRVRVEDRAVPGDPARDIVVTVDEAPATSVGYGAGLEVGQKLRRREDGTAVEELDFAPRAFFEIGRRNLWGKNRSVNLFSRASFRRSNASTTENDQGQLGFNEYRVVASYREPRVFGWEADAQITGFLEQAIRTSFSYRRNGINADLTRRVSSALTLIGRYSFGNTSVFDEQYSPQDQPLIDRLFPQVALSIFSGGFAHDTRDDVLDPSRGTFSTLDVSLANRALGGEVGFVKGFGEAFLYKRLPGSRRLVLGGGLRLGLATGFKRFLRRVDENGQEVVEVVKDLPASERFYAGGGTTVRGFSQDRLGAPGTIDQDGFPTGGNAVVILNGELRFPLWRSVGGAAFVDAGNVFLKASDLDLGAIRTAAGVGIRYRSPVGPIRVDIGFKLNPETSPSGTRERAYVVHIGLGQAF